MEYPFPDVQAECLLCGRANCARWKGYFVREMVCGVLGFSGPVAIHVGHCQTYGKDWSYYPSFLLWRRLVSKASVLRVISGLIKTRKITDCIDELIADIEGVEYFALSSAYFLVYSFISALIINHSYLGISCPELKSINVVYNLPRLIIEKFDPRAGVVWQGFSMEIFHPP